MRGGKLAAYLAVFVAGAAGGVIFAPGRSAPEKTAAPNVSASGRKSVQGDPAEVKALRRRVRELEKELAKNQDGRQMAVNAPAPSGASSPSNPPARESLTERMARLERENPARHAEITNRISQWRRSRAERAQAKIDFLSSIDVSGMSADARQTHVRLQELTLEREELEERMHYSKDITDESRRELFRQMLDIDQELAGLNRKERDNLLNETFKNLGFDARSADEITAAVKEVVDSTDTPQHFRRHRQRR